MALLAGAVIESTVDTPSPPPLSYQTALSEILIRFSQQTPPSYAVANELLAFLHTHSLRLPQHVIAAGTALIKYYPNSLGDKVWDMHEKVFLASLDAHDDTNADLSLNVLTRKFSQSSTRLTKLIAIHSEYRGNYEEAADLYNSILQQEPTHIPSHKRLIAIAKAKGKVEEAISRLTKYTKIFSSDESGWLELASIYQQQGQFELAAFCVEELILCAPENYLYHTYYAELLYSLGRYDFSRQYFSQSLELKPHNNLRSLFGIILCLKAKNTTSNAALYGWSIEKLSKHYETYAPGWLDIIKETLDLAPTSGSSSSLSPSISTNSSNTLTSTSKSIPNGAISISSGTSGTSSGTSITNSSSEENLSSSS